MSKQYMTSREIADMLKTRVSYRKRQRAIAKVLGVSESYFSDFLAGNREAGPTILKALNFETTPRYRRKP